MHHHLQLALDAIDRTTGSLPTETLNLRAPGKWSIAETLEHLTLAFRRGAAGFAKVAESGEPRATRPTFSQSVGRILVVDVAYFPRAKAPETSMPTGSIPPESVQESAHAALVKLDLAATQAVARLGDAVLMLNHPYFGGMNARQWRKFHWRHTVHHMRQVRDLLARQPSRR